MTDAALRSSVFSRLTSRRATRFATGAALDAAEALCTCTGKGACRCDAAPAIRAAEVAHDAAGDDLAAADASWRSLHAALAA